METSKNEMVLRTGDILEMYRDGNKYRITKVTKKRIICVIYYKNNKPDKYSYNRKTYELANWKQATLKWY